MRRHHQLGLVGEVQRAEQLASSMSASPLAALDDAAAAQVQPSAAHAELLRGGGQDLGLRLARRADRRVAGDEGGAAGVHADVPGRDVGVVVDDGDRVDIGSPSSSQTSCASTVSEPWPISEAPVISVTWAKSSILRIVPQPSDG